MRRIVRRLSAVAFAFLLASFLVGFLMGSTAHAQAPTPVAPVAAEHDALFATIQSLDTRLFDAYNHCDLTTFGSLLAEDLEFYHDKTGLMRGRQAVVDAVKNNICGKVTRELVPGTLEVYPIANYGAVEIGVHRFHHPGDKGTEGVGEAKFIHLWQETDGTWKVTRVISFDHHGAAK
jgi:ketosteroid isomerase-like protein